MSKMAEKNWRMVIMKCI